MPPTPHLQENTLPKTDFDLIVIGSGPAGHHGAIQGAKLGRRVAVVEKPRWLGGVCFHTGTLPSKTLREAALYLSGFRLRGIYGPSYRVKQRITPEDLLGRCLFVIQKEVEVYKAHFARNNVTLITGSARFLDEHTIAVDEEGYERQYTADKFLIAVGTVPAKSEKFPVDGSKIIDADCILQLREIPKTLIVIGGGVIGMEYACAFAVLGSRVTVVDGRKRLLEFLDDEIFETLKFYMREIGVTFRLGEAAKKVEVVNDRVHVTLESNKILTADTVLYAAGRVGATKGLNVESAGITPDERGRLKVNEFFQTEVPHIYAAGDVVGFPSLASTSMEQGRLAVAHAFGHSYTPMPQVFPYGIYTIPEVSFAGKTEEQLTQEGIPYEVGIAHYREIAKGNILGDDTGKLKILIHRDTMELLGVHIIGDGATELVHIGHAVMAHHGTLHYFIDHVFNYPTLAECYKVAALYALNSAQTSARAA